MLWRALPHRIPDRRTLREAAKMVVRAALQKHDLDLVSNPYSSRLVAALSWFGLDTVLDIGANVGQYGSSLRSSGFRGQIISCEPLTDAYNRLAHRAAEDPSWMGVNSAVGAATGTLDINVSANSYSSSIMSMTEAHRRAAPDSEYIGSLRVPVTTVRDLVAEHALDPRRALLKIDTQGYETAVLDGTGGLLGEFAAVQLELSLVPLYDGQELFPELTGRMAASGYTIYALDCGFGDRQTGRMLQCDALFVAEWLLRSK